MRFHPLVLVLAVFLVAVSYVAYRRTTPELSPLLRRVLTTMRAASFLLIAFILLDPRSVSSFQREKRVHVVALVDRSASMSLASRDTPGAASRFQLARELAGKLSDAVMRAGGKCETLWFASRLTPAGRDTVRAEGQGTDIAGSIIAAAGRYEGEPLAAIVLLSDGVDTGDRLVRPGLPDVPVFAVGVGDTTQPDDVRIEDVDYSSVVRAPSRTTVKATIEYSGQRTRRAIIRLREGSRVVYRADTLVSPSTRRVVQSIPLRFRKPGRKSFTLSADVVGGDAQPANNTRDIVIEADKASTRVVIVDMTPGWELTFLSDHLRRDQTFDFDVVSSHTPGAVRAGHMHTPDNFIKLLGACDALVIRSINSDVATPDNLAAIERFVRDRGGGLLVLPGEGSLFENAGAWNRLADLLPVRGRAPMKFRVRYASVLPGATAAGNPVTAPIVPLLSQTGWQERSPLLGYYAGVRVRAGADELVQIRGRPAPAVVLGTAGRGRVAVVCAGPLWRWRFLADDNGVYDEFVGRLLDVLSRGEESGRFVVTAGRNVFESGESPVFSAELFNERMQPVTGVPIRVEIARVDGSGRETPLVSHTMVREGPQSTRFVATVPSLTPGNYIARGRADETGRTLTSRPWKFRVSETSVEFQRDYQDRDALASLAQRTGGSYRNATIAGIMKKIDLTPHRVQASRESILRAHPLLFVLIVGLLGGEWFLRKRAGMI